MNTIIGIIFGLYLLGLSSGEYYPLDSNRWTVINENKTIRIGAVVPGSIYSDLRRIGILGNLYAGKNDVNYRWVSYDNWTYETTFNVDSTLLNKETVNLLANGIDTVSTVYINDKIVGKTDNQFIRYKYDIKDILKVGENQIRVAFESAPIYARKQSEDFKKKYNYTVGPDCQDKVYHGECHWNFIRKMASSFSWDWGPAFPTQGIWKSIGIEAYDQAIIRDLRVETFSVDYINWGLMVKVYMESAPNKTFDAIFDIKLDGFPLISDEMILKSNSSGNTFVLFERSAKPLKPITLWYPNGVANNTQKLYKLEVNLSFRNSKEVSSVVKKIGFRTIELVESPIKPEGLTFYFKVNGQPFYAKGTNWIPANVLMEDLTPEYIRFLLESVKQSNMNFMRVWGGGIYESDLFYDIADELGIMIWQDQMFACALYPATPEFLNGIDIEVRQQVRRLQPHPSIAIWSGNNENEWNVWHDPNVTQHKRDYVELYINHIMKIIFEEDSSRPFVPSSPSNGKHEKEEGWVSKNSGDPRYGDVHYYTYDAPLWDWKTFPSGKFASEYGYTSYSSLETYLQVLNETDFTVPISDNMEWRQHHPGGTKSMDKELGYYFTRPSSGGVDRFNDLVYLSQIIQAMAIKTESEFYRRNREIDPKTGYGNTMGALYWQLNDIWQGSTWASIEFGGKWKPLQSYAMQFFDNLLVSPYEDTNQTLKVSIVRDDYFGDLEFDLLIKIYKWSENKAIHEINTTVKTGSFSAKLVYTKSIVELMSEAKCSDRTECLLKFEIRNKVRKLEAQNFMLLSEPKNAKLVKPNVKVTSVKRDVNPVTVKKHFYDITLTSEAIAPFVLLDFKLKSGLKGQFIENGFFIFDGQKTIRFQTDSNYSEQQIINSITVKTVTDVI